MFPMFPHDNHYIDNFEFKLAQACICIDLSLLYRTINEQTTASKSELCHISWPKKNACLGHAPHQCFMEHETKTLRGNHLPFYCVSKTAAMDYQLIQLGKPK